MTRPGWTTFAGPVAAGLARVVLGGLWLHEGLFKYSANFGKADILLVAQSADSNSRVPGFFSWFADHTLREAPAFFGFVMPLLETSLGAALILGLATRLAALGSIITLVSYWCADQLITQYPVMTLFSIGVLLSPVASARLSASWLVLRNLKRNDQAKWLRIGPLQSWL